MIQRRTFLKRSGLALAAATLMPTVLFSCKNQRKLGLQLYSLREYIGKDVSGVIKKVAAIGFEEVETYGYSPEGKFWGLEVREFKNILTSNGLSTPSGHYGADTYLSETGTDEDLKYILDVANELNQKYVVIPHISESLRTSIEDYKRIAERLNQAGELCQNAGLKLGYHNHAFEFDDYNGQNGLEVFLENTDENLVDFELDIYWVVRAGVDPVSLFEKYPGRFPLWHVKDMSKTNPALNTEIGSGSIDYKQIFENAEKSGVAHYIVEQENFEMDPYQSLEQSFNHIQKNL